MPFEKVIITHKFGIISQTHKKQLQERLLLRRLQLENEKKRPKKNDEVINLQITEEFVKEYNEANFEKKAKLDYQCMQMFEKIKKRLMNSDLEDDLNIQLAWAELSQLMQCNSPIQEECLDLFIISMEYAPLSALQIPTLFFLAETVIYWIRTDTINQPFLRAFEIKLLKVGQLIFQRIYFYFLDDNIENQSDLKEHLSIYLQGFDDYESAYSPYPDALLYMKYMISVGKFITKEASNKTSKSESKSEEITTTTTTTSSSSSDTSTDSRITAAKLIFSPIYWQLSNLYLCLTKRNSEKLIESITENLIELSPTISNKEYWIDTTHALFILGECAKLNSRVLDCLLLISNYTPSDNIGELIKSANDSSSIKDDESSATPNASKHTNFENRKYGLQYWPWEISYVYVDVLTDICINGMNSSIKRKALYGFHKEATKVFDLRTKVLKGYGLLDAARFNLKSNKIIDTTPKEIDSSWKIRYASIKGLVNICNSLNDKENEELRRTCWASLVICQENETNPNVLEAIKVGQVKSKVETTMAGNQINKKGSNLINIVQFKLNNEDKNIFCQMAKRFSELIILEEKKEAETASTQRRDIRIKSDNPLKLNDKLESSFYDDKNDKFEDVPYGRLESKVNNKASASTNENGKQSKLIRKNRTTLKEEIEISQQFTQKIPKYYVRKNFDLMRIVEDQYRKEEKEKFEKMLENQ